MNIAFDVSFDVPNTSDLTGVFEAHITVAVPRGTDGGDVAARSEVSRFDRWCDAMGVKCVLIALPRGVCAFQPMTASYHRGALADVRLEIAALARRVASAGFEVSRVKIEATGANRGLPQTRREALRSPHDYFELHLKAVLRDESERLALETAARPFGAHLSRNARFVAIDGREERFVTLRAYGVGQREAESLFRAFEAEVRKLGVPVSHRLVEYVVYDSNAALDAGWADVPSGQEV